MAATRVTRRIAAPPAAVFRALIDPAAVGRWMVPDDMVSELHEFDARPGGRIRITLTYRDPGIQGKTTGHSDSFHGRFVRLVPDQEVEWELRFETDDAGLAAPMTVRFQLRTAPEGTELAAVHEPLPAGVDPAANEAGWSMSIAKLQRLVEQ